MNRGLVSVIIPIYNVCTYLEKSLDSVIHQTYKNIEIILINDGSTDSSPKICDKYSSLDGRIKVIHQENKGLSEARNTGMLYAHGSYFYFVDSDDYLERDIIDALVTEMSSNKLDIIGYNILIEKDDLRPYVNVNFPPDILKGEDYLIRMINAHHVCEPVWMYMYRADLIRNHNMKFAKGRLFEDEIWTPEVLLYANRVKYINKIGYHYIIRPGSITTSNQKLFTKFRNHSVNCKYLISLSPKFTSVSNRIIFRDHVARLYMEASKYLVGEEDMEKYIDYSIIYSNINGLKSYIKYLLFRYFRNVYLYLKNKKYGKN